MCRSPLLWIEFPHLQRFCRLLSISAVIPPVSYPLSNHLVFWYGLVVSIKRRYGCWTGVDGWNGDE
jgi:hypothetical protein